MLSTEKFNTIFCAWNHLQGRKLLEICLVHSHINDVAGGGMPYCIIIIYQLPCLTYSKHFRSWAISQLDYCSTILARVPVTLWQNPLTVNAIPWTITRSHKLVAHQSLCALKSNSFNMVLAYWCLHGNLWHDFFVTCIHKLNFSAAFQYSCNIRSYKLTVLMNSFCKLYVGHCICWFMQIWSI